MIICVGEILADMIGRRNGDVTAYEAVAGGAPFNVACCLKRLGVECGFYGCVGKDIIGDSLLRTAEGLGFNHLKIRRDSERNTTLAFVEVDESGERYFSFYRKNTADAHFDCSDIDEIAGLADIIHIGSLAMSTREGREFADRLIFAAHAKGARVSFDVNYREDIFECRSQAIEIYSEYINAADIIKLSDSEISMFYSGATYEEMLMSASEGGKVVLLTLGGSGSTVCDGEKIYTCSGYHVEHVVDTNGAGDSFMAGALAGIHDKMQWDDVLRMANACGALAVSQKGAFPRWSRADVERIIGG